MRFQRTCALNGVNNRVGATPRGGACHQATCCQSRNTVRARKRCSQLYCHLGSSNYAHSFNLPLFTMPKAKKGGRGRGSQSAAASSQPAPSSSRRVTRRSRPDTPAEEVATRVSEDSGIAGLQLGRFLQMVREEVQEEMQAQQARLLGSSSNNGNAVVSQPPPATSSQGASRGWTYRPDLVHVE